jgi:NAD(P)-dependent dehydrogenase (short-subunit alcohol dehydrogenase family)
VSHASQVDALIRETVSTYGRLDAAFNNAATVDGAFALTTDFTEDQFDRTIEMNLGVWLCLAS